MTTTTQNLGSLAVGFLSITNIVDTQTDLGSTQGYDSTNSFVLTDTDAFGLSGMELTAFSASASGANSSQVNVFTYNVASTSASQLIYEMDASYLVSLVGTNLSADVFSAVEQVFDTGGNLISTLSLNASNTSSVPVTFAQGYSSVNVRVTWTMAVTSAGNASSMVSASDVQQNFGTIDKSQLCSIGDIVFLDTNRDGLEDAGFDGGPGVAGVTVELLDATGTHIIATTTTGANGRYSFNNIVAGTYEVGFVTPNGYAFTTQGVGTNAGINSSANQLTGITGPITLTAGQAYHNAEAGLVAATNGGGGITVLKTPCNVVVSSCGQITYNFSVTNSGTVALSNVKITDNIGTAAAPDLTTPKAVLNCNYNVGDVNRNGILDVGETWKYTEVVNQIACNAGTNGCVSHTVTGTNLGSGCTAWFSTTFNPTSCADGARYVFQGVKCTITGGGVGSTPLVEKCGDSIMQFSSSCKQASTHYDSDSNCWITTIPANSNPGNVFCTGVPVQVPAGCNLSGATCTWTVDDASNNCGISSVSWKGDCQGYQSFNANGCNGNTDYNQIGVKVCDNHSSYGDGGCTDTGYGWNGSGYCASDNYAQNQCGWIGSSSDCAGTAENQHTSGNCGDSGGTQGGSMHFTACDTNLSAGHVAWLSATFNPTSFANGATYTFKGVTCTITGGGPNGTNLVEKMPDAVVEFSNTCTQATTHFDTTNNRWVTVLPAGQDPGNVYMTGMPVTIPSGCNFNGKTITWSVSQTSNNCGSSCLSWDASCQGYSNFNQNGHNGCTDYNQIGVKVCDNTGDYGCGGNVDHNGYGWNGTCNTGGYQSWGGCGYSSSNYSCSGWNGSDYDTAGSAENQYVGCNSGGYTYSDGYSGCGYSYSGDDYYVGSYGCYSSGYGTLCEGNIDQASCGGGTLGFATTGIHGAADTVTVTATTAAGSTVTATDTKEVQILNGCSNVTVGGAVPTASLTSIYGTAQTLEFTYNPSNVIALKQVQAGLGTVTGSNSAQMAYVVISNQNAPFATNATVYFKGSVIAGEQIYADATQNVLTNTPVAAPNNHFSTTAGADVYAYVFASQAAFLAGQAPSQTIAYNTSGSQAMHLGDQVGSLTLSGYVGSNGGYLSNSTCGSTTGTGSGSSGDTLTLHMSEDAYQGDAQFTVTVNGQQVGGAMTVNALHCNGDGEVFVLNGNWGSGIQQVGISFINDASGGCNGGDRNLYVNSINYDGTTYANTAAALYSAGTSTFAVGGSTATAATVADVLTLNLSEDAYNGDAQFMLFIDGKQISTAQSVSALHSSSGSQAFAFSGNFGAGSHTVGVQFTNDAYGGTSSTDRNLYVNSIGLNGATVSGASAALYSNGTANFAITTLH